MTTYFKKGSWNSICDVCGFEYKSHELKKRWDGMMVCKEDWEARHPLDFQRVKQERQSVPWTSPDDSEGEITVTSKAASENYAVTDTEHSIWLLTTGASVTVTFPQLDDDSILTEYSVNVPRTWKITVDEDSTDSAFIVVSGTSTLIGSTTLLAGQTTIIRSIPSDNTYIRDQ